MDNDSVESNLEEMLELSIAFNAAMDSIKKDREEYWESLNHDQQLKCFCAVVDRIVEGEKEGRSYRGMLYSVFGFGPESYAQAQMAGFLELHNCFMTSDRERDMLVAFAKHVGIENPDEVVSNYYKR